MAADQLSKKNPDGTKLGQSASDLISLYGVTPVVQRTFLASLTAGSTTASVKASIARIRQVLIAVGIMAPS